MEKITLFTALFLILNFGTVYSQVGINEDGSTPDVSAMLDVKSTSSGILIPRMKASERNSITSPATGLLVYVIDDNNFYYYNGSEWIRIAGQDNLTGNGSATRVAFWSDSHSLSSSSDLYWDNSNNRLGVGTSSPHERLEINGNVRGNQSGALRISTGNGYIDIGPKNSSWSHFYTDRPRFFFSKGITVDEGLIGSYNEDLQLQTSGTTRITISNSTGNVGIGETSPHSSAILEVSSTTKGVVFPRMTNIQMNAIPSPVAGMQIYNTTNGCMYFYDGTNWLDLQTCDCGTLKDYDGNIYQAVKIGNQCWMAENLKVTHYPDGTAILHITDNTQWQNLGDNNTDDAYCYYNNDANNQNIYGNLYTYAAAIADNWEHDNNSGQGVCPDGWHLPTYAEWQELVDYLGGYNVAGGKLKETGTSHWQAPNTGATNETGFTALPGGHRYNSGPFTQLHNEGLWWSATEASSSTARFRHIYNNRGSIYSGSINKSYGFSVRCIKDN